MAMAMTGRAVEQIVTGSDASGGSGVGVTFVAADLSSGGGVNRVIRDLAVLFTTELGFKVTVVNARSDRSPAYPFPRSVRVQNFRDHGRISYAALLWRLRKTRPKYVIGSWTQDNILLILIHLFTTTEVVVVEHISRNFQPYFVRLLRRLVYPFASHIVVLNPQDLHYYKSFTSRVSLIPNPVDPGRLNKRTREKLFLAVGHLNERKNFQDALRAMARSGLEEEEWSLAIVGDGTERAKLRALAANLGLRRVHIHPPTNDIASWYARASVLVMTSRIEGYPLVLAEAMQAGVIPLSYAIDGCSYILDNFPDHLISFGDIEAFAASMVRIAHAGELDELRIRLRASIGSRSCPKLVAAQWRQLLLPTSKPGKPASDNKSIP